MTDNKPIIQKEDIPKLVGAVVITQLAGFIGAFFTTPNIPTWYASLAKPAINPPNWIFGPVWTILYTLQGIALYLVWKEGRGGEYKKTAYIAYFTQLTLNTIWSILFFGLKSPELAVFEISLLWVAIVATMVLFFRINRLAGLLFIPYLLWVSFAAFLNLSIVKLN